MVENMAIIAAILAVIVIGEAISIVAMQLSMKEVRNQAARDVNNANRTVQMLLQLVDKPPETPPDKLIGAIGATINKIMTGQPMVVNENKQAEVKEEEPYYPDVEFDAWLGTEGIPPTAGWWSPPKNDENTENIN